MDCNHGLDGTVYCTGIMLGWDKPAFGLRYWLATYWAEVWLSMCSLPGHGETSQIYPEQRKQTSKPFQTKKPNTLQLYSPRETSHIHHEHRKQALDHTTKLPRFTAHENPKRGKEISVRSREFIHHMQSSERIPSPKPLCKAIHSSRCTTVIVTP